VFSIISLTLSGLTRYYEVEELSLLDIFTFSATAILISASLSSFAKRVIEKSFYKTLLAFIFGLLSCFIYFEMFLFTFESIPGGESGMMFGGIFGVVGSIAVGVISTFINFLMLLRKRVEGRTIRQST
jgi:hypothetical protein